MSEKNILKELIKTLENGDYNKDELDKICREMNNPEMKEHVLMYGYNILKIDEDIKTKISKTSIFNFRARKRLKQEHVKRVSEFQKEFKQKCLSVFVQILKEDLKTLENKTGPRP